MTMISMIAAMAKHRVIGCNNQMPWHLPADFAWFKRMTVGKPVIMGRKTFESIGRPLPQRVNIVISRDQNYTAEGVIVVNSINEALIAAGKVEEVMIIGGSHVYEQCLLKADRLYVTHIDAEINGDAFFPEFGDEWVEQYKETYEQDEKNRFNLEFVILDRKKER